MVVVDTNIIAYLYLGSEFLSRAEAQMLQDPDWVAPPLWRSELRNVLAGCMRRKALSVDDACRIQADAERLMAGGEQDVDSRRVLDLVRRSDCSSYDCEFVALAMRLDVKLVTMDSKVLSAFPKCAVPLPRV